ncbi:cation efflux protein [Chytridium lagenaria]|nr:cation efflux protein [Chytridium lagenaria]
MPLSTEQKIYLVGSLTLTFFFVEITTGLATNSVSLIADSIHMLSDLAALIVGLVASRLARRTAPQATLTYGYRRAEVLGAFANGVILLALAFSIILSAIERFLSPEGMSNPLIVLIVGTIGLGINMVGMFVFSGSPSSVMGSVGDRSRSNHSHSHSHQDCCIDHHDDSHNHQVSIGISTRPLPILPSGNPEPHVPLTPLRSDFRGQPSHRQRLFEDWTAVDTSMSASSHMFVMALENFNTPRRPHSSIERGSYERTRPPKHAGHNHGGHNHGGKSNSAVRALFIHAMADGVGNIAVIAASLTQLLAKGDWTQLMDPIMSLIITCVVVYTAVPLVRATAAVLLQAVPNYVSVDKVRREITEMQEVVEIKTLNIWGLTDIEAIASIHVVLRQSIQDHNEMSYVTKRVKGILTANGVSETTVEISFDEGSTSPHENMILDELYAEK